MARRDQSDEFERTAYRTPRKRKRKWRTVFGFMLVATLLFVVFLPSIVARPSVLLPLIDRFAGIAPLKVEFETVQAGWFKPVGITGIQLLDGDARLLAKIASIETEKGIWSWIRNSADLGTIRVRGIESAIAAGNGTTNIEQALKPLLDQYASAEQPQATDAFAAAMPTGTLDIQDSKFLLMEVNRLEQWVVAVPKLSVVLPKATQVIGPIEFQATMAEVSGTVADSYGTVAANVRQTEGSPTFELRAKLDHVPVDFWHVIRARMPELPVDELHGRVSAVLSGNVVDAERWTFDVQTIESRGLHIVAPSLVGNNPAHLERVAASGRASLAGAVLKVEAAQLTCDFAEATASATLAWPIDVPTAADPFLKGGVIDAQGVVDLPKLAQAAQSLIPLREDTRLLAGNAQFAISQTLDARGAPTSRAKLQLTGLQALASGQNISWNDPLIIEAAADRGASGLQVGAMVSAEFCNVKIGGSIEAGQVVGNVNLDLLQKRLSEYVELPIRTMTGSADVNMSWKLVATDTVQASGTLTTTPLTIAATTGGQIQEPAWNGEFSATAKLAGGSPESIQHAQLKLTSLAEQLSIDLKEPISLLTADATKPKLEPAMFTINLVGDLANWKRRGTMWLTEPPELNIGGNLSLAVGGRIDMNHVEVLEANWRSQPLQVSTPQFSVAEPQMVGNFKGRVDTNDLTRLVVDKLEVQATSFSLGARDSANPDGSGSRVGQAMFLLDLDRVLKNVQTQTAPAAILPADASPTTQATQYSATGRVQGQLNWQVNTQAAAFDLRADGEQIVLLSKAPGAAAALPMWDEPRATALINGHYVVASGDANIESLQVQIPWMNYAGNLAYRSVNGQQAVQMKGQAVYDSVALTAKLTPLIGNQLQLYGQQTVPIEVSWLSSTDPQASSLVGLKAATRIGWEQARVAGIELGKADVPVNVDAGRLATSAEFAVSGGKLRWDVTSDLTADELVILQKPMTVLENVEITEQMCQGWLKYVAPLMAEATSIDGRLSLRLEDARLTPADPKRQTVAGQLVIHNATVGPGPLSNQVISLVKQVEAIRKQDFTQAVSSQKVWMDMPEQKIDFQMSEGRVSHRNVNVKIGDARISTAGSVSVEGQLDLVATMPIPDNWIEKSPLLAGLQGQSLQFPIRGTVSQPQMNTEGLSQLSRQAVQGAANSLIQKGLSRGFEKIFGGQPPPPVTPPTGP